MPPSPVLVRASKRDPNLTDVPLVRPSQKEDYIKYLKKAGRLDMAAQELANVSAHAITIRSARRFGTHPRQIVNDETFVSTQGKSKHDLWSELLNLVLDTCMIDYVLALCVSVLPHSRPSRIRSSRTLRR